MIGEDISEDWRNDLKQFASNRKKDPDEPTFENVIGERALSNWFAAFPTGRPAGKSARPGLPLQFGGNGIGGEPERLHDLLRDGYGNIGHSGFT